MYEYTWYQWLLFFFLYCFFGWIFESTYVSLKTRHFVNRGFLRLPMLPLYGTGAVMMLWVSLPVKDNLFLVYIFGVIAATLLEYVTGWGMERLFKMKYWDYSCQRFNLNGYICLTSSIAWGFLTILLTEVIHRPIERYVLGLPLMVNITVVIVITVLFAADAAQSVRAALDLAKVLDAMTTIRAELDDIQVQMALMKEDAAERLNVIVENTVERMEDLVEDTAEKMGGLVEDTADKVAKTAERLSHLTENAAARVSEAWHQHSAVSETQEGDLGEEAASKSGDLDQRKGHDVSAKLEILSQRLSVLREKRHTITGRIDFYKRSILKGNPTATSSKFAEALKELREIADKKKR